MEREQTGTRVTAPLEKCPFFPHKGLAVTVQSHVIAPSPAGAFYADLQSHPACTAQPEARQRISFDQSSQKRGPPSARLS